MAKVYMATQNSLNRSVAIKVLHSQSDEQYAQRFVSEAHTLAAINHPRVITIYDVSYLEDGRPYFVMECLDGGDLNQFKGLKLDPTKALVYMKQIAEGLCVVHGQRIVHRDIKPANILFRDANNLVLSDFGIAKSLQGDGDLTRDGSTVGSPFYCSPEQSMDRILDPRSDLYSLGVVFLEMLVGRNPYVGESVTETVVNHLQMDVPTLPPELSLHQGIIDRLLAKDPSDRFQSAEELIVAIDSALGYSAASSYPGKLELGGVFTGVVPARLGVLLLGVCLAVGVWFAFIFESETDLQIKSLLASASLSVDEARFEAPESNNARYFFEQTLLLEPENRAALEGLQNLQATQIAYYLSAAQESVDAEHWYLPEGDNATFFYFKVLALDQNNTEARKGLASLVAVYVESAQLAFEQREYRTAFGYLKEGLKLDPENELLLSLKEEYLHQSNAVKRFLNRVFK